jgi:DNA-binding FrmR family transcriptional regulator
VSVDQKITNAVKLALGEQVFQIIALQTQCQDLADQLSAAKQAVENLNGATADDAG